MRVLGTERLRNAWHDEQTTKQVLMGIAPKTLSEAEKARYLETLSLQVAPPPQLDEDW